MNSPGAAATSPSSLGYPRLRAAGHHESRFVSSVARRRPGRTWRRRPL